MTASLTSFLTLELDDGELMARVGAAPLSDIPELVGPCSYSVLVREPSEVPARIRFGSATLSEDGLAPSPLAPSESRGAWLRVLVIAQRISKRLFQVNLPADPTIDGWWHVPRDHHEFTTLPASSALDTLALPSSFAGDALVALRGPRDHVAQLVVAITRHARHPPLFR